MSDIKFISVDPLTKKASFVLSSTKVQGMEKLSQMVISSLLTSPGSDILDEESGGGIEDLVGVNVGESDISEVQAEVTRRVSKTQREIIQNQIGVNISAEEKLRKIEVVSIKQGDTTDSLDVYLRIENEVGRIQEAVI